jgi:hypothetical protein
MIHRVKHVVVCATLACAAACANSDAPAGPSAPAVPSPASVVSVSVTGVRSMFQRGQTAQLRAMATLSNGFVEDRSSSAQWQSDNTGVASVSPSGIVSAGNEGDASISATVGGQRGALGLSVRYANRTPDPAAGQQLPLPDIRGALQQFANERPDLLAQSCQNGVKYVNNPWLDYMVDRLRTLDTRWGYNAKPTRTAADNGGIPVVAAGDEIAYNYTSGPDEGSTGVYLIDILESHCGSPRLTYRHFTGEEPGRWTGLGRF